jgi:hypothetical protein
VDDAYGGGGCGKIEFRDERCRNERLTKHQHATGDIRVHTSSIHHT